MAGWYGYKNETYLHKRLIMSQEKPSEPGNHKYTASFSEKFISRGAERLTVHEVM